jgi:3-dehydroquinate synthase
MTVIRQQVTVSFRYPVHFTHDLFAASNPLLAEVLLEDALPGAAAKRVLVVVDEGMAHHHPALTAAIEDYFTAHPQLKLVAPPLTVQGGEGTKNTPDNVHDIQRAVHTYGIDRHSYILAVGGGALLDMVGYAAATSHRGVRLVRIPTTVLSQNDSAVGVKNGINAFDKKNFLGTFAPPYAVLNDAAFLETLSERDWLGGLSEAVKVALLKDAAFFDFLETNAEKLKNRDAEAMAHAVYRCAELHLAHIATSGDAFEFGSSRPLDFGHWAAHKLEALTGYDLRHGEAVAIGLALDSVYSHLAGMLTEGDLRRILNVFDTLGLATFVPELENPAVIGGLGEFREHLGGRLTIMLLEGIGRGKEVHEMDETLIHQAITQLREGTWHTPRTPREAVH